MTQIVYDGRHLLADRKCTYGYYTPIDAPKVFKLQVGDITRYFAFSGSFRECALGEEVVRSNFDPEVRNKVQSVLDAEVLEQFLGIVVDVSPVGKRVCLINYAGDSFEINPNQFIAIGGMSSELTSAWKVWRRVYVTYPGDHTKQAYDLADFVRLITEGTSFDQTGRTFDIYDTETGELR